MNDLTAAQRSALQARLEHSQAALLRQLAGDLDSNTDVRQPAPHEAEASPADNASQRTLNALVQEAAEHSDHQLQLVRQALARLADGSYGLCSHCGEAIGYARLDARPEAALCITCQTRQELGRR